MGEHRVAAGMAEGTIGLHSAGSGSLLAGQGTNPAEPNRYNRMAAEGRRVAPQTPGEQAGASFRDYYNQRNRKKGTP